MAVFILTKTNLGAIFDGLNEKCPPYTLLFEHFVSVNGII